MKKYYELFIINKTVGYNNIKKNILILINYIIFNNGIVLKVEFCGEKNFFYKIKKNYKGYYIFLLFYFNSSLFLKKIYFFLKKNNNILRFLIINVKNNNYITDNYL